MARTRTEKRQGRAGLFALVGSLAAGLAGGSLIRWGEALLPSAAVFLGLVTIFGLGIVATLPWWRSLDPMQREAQYFGWHWGGIVGLTAILATLIAFSGLQSELTRGALLLAMGQVGGYALFWLVWTLRHRGESA